MDETLSHTQQRTIRAFRDFSRSLTQSTWRHRAIMEEEGEGKDGDSIEEWKKVGN